MSKSEKIASELEKLALRAWKVNIGKIGEKGKQLLVDKGILNYDKEIEGLNKGSDKLIARHGGVVTHFNEDELVEHARKSLKEDPLYSKLHAEGLADINSLAEGGRLGLESSGGNVSFPYGKKPIVNRGTVPERMRTGDSSLDNYSQAIINRHEADELRYAQVSKATPKKNVNVLGAPMSTTTFKYTGHSSPKVIVQESAHVAIAPPVVAGNLKRMRARLSVSEQGLIREHAPNFEYGVSGRVDTGAGVKAENAYIKMNKPAIVAFKNSVEGRVGGV